MKHKDINNNNQQEEMQHLVHIFYSTKSVNYLTKHHNDNFLPVVTIQGEDHITHVL